MSLWGFSVKIREQSEKGDAGGADNVRPVAAWVAHPKKRACTKWAGPKKSIVREQQFPYALGLAPRNTRPVVAMGLKPEIMLSW